MTERSGITKFARGSMNSAASDRMSLIEADSVLASLWDQDALVWDKYWVPVFALFAKDLAAYTSAKPGDIVLDLGTGSGIAAFEMCKAVPSVGLVVGIDRSEAMIRLARRKTARTHLPNVRFFRMDAEAIHFPDSFFDVAISNCGIGIVNFDGLREILRVLKPGGILAFNDWHLIDVTPHRLFGEILRKHRNKNPSPQLARERAALAAMESFHRPLNPKTQRRLVSRAGFVKATLTGRKYRVCIRNLDEYLRMRLTRATLRREISQMVPHERRLFHADLDASLRQFVLQHNFVFDWHVFYILARKRR
jgi:ubiquinone/menaquinone biosynthesis C-methylase UbiE